MAYFSSSVRTEEMITLAWFLENGSGKFYQSLSEMVNDQEGKLFFRT